METALGLFMLVFMVLVGGGFVVHSIRQIDVTNKRYRIQENAKMILTELGWLNPSDKPAQKMLPAKSESSDSTPSQEHLNLEEWKQIFREVVVASEGYLPDNIKKFLEGTGSRETPNDVNFNNHTFVSFNHTLVDNEAFAIILFREVMDAYEGKAGSHSWHDLPKNKKERWLTISRVATRLLDEKGFTKELRKRSSGGWTL